MERFNIFRWNSIAELINVATMHERYPSFRSLQFRMFSETTNLSFDFVSTKFIDGNWNE